MTPTIRERTIVSKRIDPFNLIPYVYVVAFFILGAFTVFFVLNAVRSFSAPESIMGLFQALIFYSVPVFTVWIMSRAVRFVISFRREMSKVLIGPEGIRIYRPYARFIDITMDELAKTVLAFRYAKKSGMQQGYRSDEYIVSLLLSDGQSLSMTCSSENFSCLRQAIDSLEITTKEVDESELQLFL